MLDANSFLTLLSGQRLIAIVRLQDGRLLVPVAEALSAGGLQLIEFALTTPGAMDQLHEAAVRLGDRVCLGVGTVLEATSVQAAVEAGAQFIVTPVLKPEVIAACRRQDIPCVAGAYTPTEIQTAWESGAKVVKVFPASTAGPGYIRELLAPLPHLRLVPTGGVNLENATAFLHAGAVAVGVGSQLVDGGYVRNGRLDLITERARQFLAQTGTGPA